VTNGQFVVLQDPRTDLTFIAIRHPQGTWRLSVARGSTLRQMLVAGTLAPPRAGGAVHRVGRHWRLGWWLHGTVGTRAVIVENAPRIHHVLATVAGGSGALTFKPAPGPAGRRSIIAIIARGGVPARQVTIAHYVVPSTRRAAGALQVAR
jgi:hypothetical protein